MAIAVETTFPGGTLDEYDGLLEQLGFHPQGQAEPGCLFHWVTKNGGRHPCSRCLGIHRGIHAVFR
jgi:hypothetical protein